MLKASTTIRPAWRPNEVGREAPLLDDASMQILAEIQTIGETFAASPRLESVLEGIIRSGLRLTGGDDGSVMLLSEDGRELVVTAAVGSRSSILIGSRQSADASIAGQALRGDGHVFVRGVASGEIGPRSDHPQALAWGLVLPLRVSGRLLGTLNINTRLSHGELPAERLTMLAIVANQAAIMVEVARLYQDLARKERRLELFVDKFLRMKADRGDSSAAGGAPETEIVRRSSNFASPASSPAPGADASIERLSGRELEVLALIVDGNTNKEIAARLYLSPDTVKNHVVHVIQKLGVSDRTQAAVVAIRHGLVA